MRFIGIIPARYASTRFPGKPLADLGGMTMIERVYRRASEALPLVWVATDDDRIRRAVEAFGGRVVMTSPDHRSGTDRCYEALTHIQATLTGDDSRIEGVVNIQGDEPFVATAQIRQLTACFSNPETDIATLARAFDPARGFDALADPNLVKLVVSEQGRALYFSRSVIPYVRGKATEEWASAVQYYTHVGMYAYRTEALRRIVGLPQSPLEKAESLEQLRWLQGGMAISVAVTDCETIGIDTPADLEAARRFLCGD